MPEPISMSRVRVAVWAVLCAAGLVATTGLNSSSARDSQPEQPEQSVSAECGQYIADIEKHMAKAKQEGKEDGVLAFSRIQVDAEGDCHDELRNHFGGDR